MANSFYSSARGACRTRREKWRKNNTSLSASSAARRVQARQLATRRSETFTSWLTADDMMPRECPLAWASSSNRTLTQPPHTQPHTHTHARS